MGIDTLIEDGWQRHDSAAEAVFTSATEAIDRVEAAADVQPLAKLVFHVGCAHLGRWADTIAALDRLRARPCCRAGDADEKAVWRLIAAAGHPAGRT
jgi:hypothetical protein